jgi:hypothetical protein
MAFYFSRLPQVLLVQMEAPIFSLDTQLGVLQYLWLWCEMIKNKIR